MKKLGIFLGLTAVGALSGYTLLALYWITAMVIPFMMMNGTLPPNLKEFILLGGLVGSLIGAHYAGVRLYLKE